ncbi:DNA primase [Pontiella sulfatireligans]|uniref:DNA primase n=1 Tax=Pontiella sulfatireligans TaxID=2750658 RepID=A0A6C2UNQ3_9BACT|nr:DNA primase [Pontiella sulfatireligans]VGO21689.1 DNA primase [Pontiella sulfatireligans]
MIPKETIEDIRARCNIVDVVGSYLPELRRRGSTYKCNCPFHKEKTPSFTVNDARQIFHCFGCGAGGDVFRFVMDYEKVDFVTAIKVLAERVGVEIVYEGGAPEKSGNKDVLYKLHTDAAAFYHRMLLDSPEGAEARRYLEERDLPVEIIKEFQIGFAPNGWEELLCRAVKKGYEPQQLEAAGLVVPSDRGGKISHYDRFRNRVMFPICDQMGRVIGFSGRIMNKAEKGAKYVNSPETLLFKKNQVLYAFDKARKPIVESRQAIVVEGQIDAIRCHQAGLSNVIASQGTALTENHARLIKRYADEVILVLDSDAAGLKAALGSSETFIATELSVRVVTLPEKEDPDSLIKNSGAEALTKLIAEAPSALDFLVDAFQKQEDMSTEAGRMRVVQAVINLINHCPSAARRDPMIHHAADRLNISPLALSQDLRRAQRQQRAAPRAADDAPVPTAMPPQKTYPRQETALLELLVHHYHDVHALVHDYLPPHLLTDPVCKTLVETLMLDPPETLTEGFHDYDEDTQKVITRVQVEESRTIDAETTPAELAQRYILIFWKRFLEREQAELKARTDISNEERFKEGTRLRHDLYALAKGWEGAMPMLGARLHSDVDF